VRKLKWGLLGLSGTKNKCSLPEVKNKWSTLPRVEVRRTTFLNDTCNSCKCVAVLQYLFVGVNAWPCCNIYLLACWL